MSVVEAIMLGGMVISSVTQGIINSTKGVSDACDAYELYQKEYTSIKDAWQNLIDNEKCSLKLLCGFTAGLKKQNQQWLDVTAQLKEEAIDNHYYNMASILSFILCLFIIMLFTRFRVFSNIKNLI